MAPPVVPHPPRAHPRTICEHNQQFAHTQSPATPQSRWTPPVARVFCLTLARCAAVGRAARRVRAHRNSTTHARVQAGPKLKPTGVKVHDGPKLPTKEEVRAVRVSAHCLRIHARTAAITLAPVPVRRAVGARAGERRRRQEVDAAAHARRVGSALETGFMSFHFSRSAARARKGAQQRRRRTRDGVQQQAAQRSRQRRQAHD